MKRQFSGPTESRQRFAAAFTLLELMIVVAIMGVILAAGIPSLYRLAQKEGMRKATSDVMEIFSKARARAILDGAPVDLIIRPVNRHLEIGSAPETASVSGETEDFVVEKPRPRASVSASAVQIGENVAIEALLVNLTNYRESEWVRVRFYPNGTCDEMQLVLVSDKDEVRGIELEVTTGLATLVTDLREIETWKIR
jgi:prepilin-type N-terminal cleavage/methylation domain-containing protein